ncbi:MAG: ABC transporter ATP-binding protein [Vicinamibacterales bacterium]
MTATAQGGFDRVEIRDVSRHFGRRKAVSRVSLTLRRGDILGLLGPNGAGKSTLLSMLATLVTPSSGAIAYGQWAAKEHGPIVRGCIGVLGHELHLYPELSARQNLEFFASLYALDVPSVVPRALVAAGLVDRADDLVSSFSRGMRQRLALERSLMHAPTLVLLDEPFTGLDDRAVGIVAARFRQLASTGAMLVVATHDLDVADGLITRMAVMQSGKLLQTSDSATNVRQQYRALVGAA